MSAPTPAPGDDRPREGYYPDPSIPGYVRYWNGAAWVPGTSRPAPSDGEPLASPPGSGPSGAVEETGPHFFDEDPAPDGEPGRSASGNALHGTRPEPASAWGADRSRQTGFGGDQDRRVSWGSTPGADPRDPRLSLAADPGDGPADSGDSGRTASADGTATIPPAAADEDAGAPEGTVVFRRPTPSGRPEAAEGADPSRSDGTMAFGPPSSRAGQQDGGAPASPAALRLAPDPRPGRRPAGSGPRPAVRRALDGTVRPPAGAAAAAGLAGSTAGPAAGRHRPGGPGGDRSGRPCPPGRAATGAAALPVRRRLPAAGPADPAGRLHPADRPARAGRTPAGRGPAVGRGPHGRRPRRRPALLGPAGAPARRAAEERAAGRAVEAAGRGPRSRRPPGGRPRPGPRGSAGGWPPGSSTPWSLGAVTAAAAVPLVTKAIDHIDEKIDAAKLSGETVTVWLVDGTTVGATSASSSAVLLARRRRCTRCCPPPSGAAPSARSCSASRSGTSRATSPRRSARALRRWLVYSVPGLLVIGVVGVLWCLFDRPWRQCWHDKAAHTFVAG